MELGFVNVGCGAQLGNRLGDREELLSADIHCWLGNIIPPKLISVQQVAEPWPPRPQE